jgi:excisionase family DNA binding protein
MVQLALPFGRVQNEGVPVSYLSVDEAAEQLKVGRQRIYDLIRAGRLEAVKLEDRTWLVTEESVRNFRRRGKGGRPRKKPAK